MPVGGLLYQGMIIAGLGFMVFSFLMKRYSPSVVASFNFVSPISGVFLSVWMLGESVTASIVAGVVLVGAGLYLAAGGRRG
jgi:drug/metabolite transporter (DMT)-like permease